MTISRLTCVGFATAVALACAHPSRAGTPNGATRDLLDEYDGLRAMFDGERMIALYGVPFDTDNDSRTSTDDFVRNFLAFNPDVLGVIGLELRDPPPAINIRDDKFRVYTYEQELEALPVHGSVVKIPVLLGATEKMSYIGMRLFQPPPDPLPPDVLDGPAAVNVVAQSPEYGHLTTFTTPDKVIFEAPDEALHRVWRFQGYDDDESYLFFVDTNSGALLAVHNMVFSADVSGTVTGFATPGIGADNPNNPDSYPVSMPMGGVLVRIVETEDEMFTELQVIDEVEYATFAFTLPDGTYTVESLLVGEWVTVENRSGENLVVSSVCDTPPACVVNLVFNCPTWLGGECIPTGDWPPEFATAQVNAFLVTEFTHDEFVDWQPTAESLIDWNMRFRANIDQEISCNARAGPPQSPEIMTARANPGTCRNFAFSTMITHEYGHFIVYQLLGIKGYGEDFLPFGEGAGDTLAALMWNTPLFGLDVFSDDDWVRNQDDDFRLVYPCVIEGDPEPQYACGQAMAGAFWDTRTSFIGRYNDPPGAGITKINELFADFLFVTDGPLDQSVLVEVLIVDDDDGDLSGCVTSDFCTPNSDLILASFRDLHGWDNPFTTAAEVKVEWVGPLEPYEDPALGTDFFVYDEIVPPNVTLKTTEKDTVPVQRWRIGRVPDGGAQSLGTVTADWVLVDNRSYNIPVEVGTIPGNSVGDVSIVEIPAQSPSNWSNIRLQLGVINEEGVVLEIGNLQTRAQAYTDDSQTPLGGRIDGTIAGNANNIVAYAIGEGDSGSGTLTITGDLKGATLGTIPDGSALSADTLTKEVLRIEGDLAGDIKLSAVVGVTSIQVLGDVASTGSILVDHDIDSPIYIFGSMSGDIHADALRYTLTVNGELAGTLAFSTVAWNGSDLMGDIGIFGLGESEGDILVNGDIQGPIHIAGAMSGDIHADADGDGCGAITGAVTIDGAFTGDICGTNLTPGGPLPPEGNIDIPIVGQGATICGQPFWIPGSCSVEANCHDGDECTTHECDDGTCTKVCKDRPYGDISPPPDPAATFPCSDPEERARMGDGFLTMLDPMCAFNAMNGGPPFASCPCADVQPCGGDGFLTMLDVMAIFNTMNDPSSAPCPNPCVCYSCGAGMGMGAGGPEGNRIVECGDVLVAILTTIVPVDVGRYQNGVEMITDWLAERMTMDQRSDLANKLRNPSIDYARDDVARMVPLLVEILLCEDM